MTISEAAEHAGVNAMTVRRWIRAGKLKAEKRDSNGAEVWYVELEDLDAILNTRGVRAEPPVQVVEHAPVRVLEDVLSVLREQLAEKDKQIERLQQLLLQKEATQADIVKALPVRNVPKPESAAPARAQQKPGFWATLFGKR